MARITEHDIGIVDFYEYIEKRCPNAYTSLSEIANEHLSDVSNQLIAYLSILDVIFDRVEYWLYALGG